MLRQRVGQATRQIGERFFLQDRFVPSLHFVESDLIQGASAAHFDNLDLELTLFVAQHGDLSLMQRQCFTGVVIRQT